MNIETKKINDSKTCQDFASALRDRIETKGYLTPQIGQLLDYLDKSCPNFDERARANLSKQVVTLSQDRDTPLQSLYAVGSLLKGLDLFTTEDLEKIGGNVFSFLSEIYGQKIALDEYSVNTRIAGWIILDEIVVSVSSELKVNILQLSSAVGKLDNEDGFIQRQVLELSLKLIQKK